MNAGAIKFEDTINSMILWVCSRLCFYCTAAMHSRVFKHLNMLTDLLAFGFGKKLFTKSDKRVMFAVQNRLTDLRQHEIIC